MPSPDELDKELRALLGSNWLGTVDGPMETDRPQSTREEVAKTAKALRVAASAKVGHALSISRRPSLLLQSQAYLMVRLKDRRSCARLTMFTHLCHMAQPPAPMTITFCSPHPRIESRPSANASKPEHGACLS